MSDVKDRCGWIGIYRNNRIRILHTSLNWILPETPQVMINFGLTVRPLNPIWRRGFTHPASINGRVDANCPPSNDANSLIISKSSTCLTPRPAYNNDFGIFNTFFLGFRFNF